VPVDIVVGVPNFRFRGTPSPLVLEQRSATRWPRPPRFDGNSSNSLSNAMYSQRSRFPPRSGAGQSAAQGVVNLPNELTAAVLRTCCLQPSQDHARQERADGRAIFSTEVPYRDLYTWDVRSRSTTTTRPPAARENSPLVLARTRSGIISYSPILPSCLGRPAPPMIMQGNQPLAQELLTYTPRRMIVRVPVTVSVDTRGA